jgi:hypothetical protein
MSTNNKASRLWLLIIIYVHIQSGYHSLLYIWEALDLIIGPEASYPDVVVVVVIVVVVVVIVISLILTPVKFWDSILKEAMTHSFQFILIHHSQSFLPFEAV